MHANKAGFNILHHVGFSKNHEMLHMVEEFIMTEFPGCHEQIFNMLATAKTRNGDIPSARGDGRGVKFINKYLTSFREHGLPAIHYGGKRNDEQQGDPSKCKRLRDSKVTDGDCLRRQTRLFDRHAGDDDKKAYDHRDDARDNHYVRHSRCY